jgi:MFS family permease
MRERLPPALRERDFSLLWVTNIVAGLATQMILVAVGWQVYAIHRDPLDLGLIGLVEFVPLLLLALPAGQLADVVSRRAIIAVSLGMEVAIALLLLVVTISGGRTLWPYLALAAASGVAAGISAPALRALLPETVPADILAGAMALRSVGWQISVVAGPAIGGIVFEISPKLLYALSASLFVGGLGCALGLQRRPAASAPGS